jgi:FtsP/CotA-like multicopper oxidase with cupredoxin domain
MQASASRRTCARLALPGALCACLIACGQVAVTPQSGLPRAPDELREPATISSANGLLDLLVIAKAEKIAQFLPYQPSGLVYEICTRPSDGADQCATDASGGNAYGGTRLQLSPGDLLRVHLVNRLPPNSDLSTGGPADDFLKLNPTNIHLHGMLVSPRYATSDDATWGDNVFIYNFNSANGSPTPGSNLHGTAMFDALDYRIPIPSSHPSGLFWFHPHVHGISEDQISAGLSGIITVGQVGNYACSGGSCGAANQVLPPLRHLILKDTQILADGSVQYKVDSEFCGPDAQGHALQPPGQGACEGVDQSDKGDSDFTGGRWYFTINGQQYPSITIGSPAGQILRIVNASADATYDLNLWDQAESRQMAMQVISVDGVSIDADAAGRSSSTAQAASSFGALNCGAASGQSSGVCTTLLHLMPSSRAEVWVTYRDSNGVAVAPPPGSGAILRSSGYQAGPGGDSWPAVDLAKIRFVADGSSAPIAASAQLSSPITSENLANDLKSANADVPSDSNCVALAAGHKRRIFFSSPSPGQAPGAGQPAPPPDQFYGLGYEEVDENDQPIPGTFIDVAPFDPATPTVCLPLAAGNLPAIERWELVNLSGSDHNFHMHQAHFSVLSAAEVNNTALPPVLQGRGVMMDSLPLLHADGRCESVAGWRNGLCTAHVATVQISFSIAGDFVYHCHILAHEDGGMMAVIRVRSDPVAPSLLSRLLSNIGVATGAPRQPVTRVTPGVMCRTPPR